MIEGFLFAIIAQLVEHGTCNTDVVGAIPTVGSKPVEQVRHATVCKTVLTESVTRSGLKQTFSVEATHDSLTVVSGYRNSQGLLKF